MTNQVEIFEFFQKMSLELEKDGYKILDKLIHEFPNIPSQEEIFDKRREEIRERERDHLEENGNSDTNDVYLSE